MLIIVLVFKIYLGLLSEKDRCISNWLSIFIIRVFLFLHAALGFFLWGGIRELSDEFWLLLQLLGFLSLLRLLSPDLLSELRPMLLIVFHEALVLRESPAQVLPAHFLQHLRGQLDGLADVVAAPLISTGKVAVEGGLQGETIHDVEFLPQDDTGRLKLAFLDAELARVETEHLGPL